MIYVLYIYIYIYICIHISFYCRGVQPASSGSRFAVRDSEDQLRELKEHAVVLASARGDLSIMGLLLKLAMRRDVRRCTGEENNRKTWRCCFGCKEWEGGTVYLNVFSELELNLGRT